MSNGDLFCVLCGRPMDFKFRKFDGIESDCEIDISPCPCLTKGLKKKRDEDIAVCQMQCAKMFYSGGSMPIHNFISDCGLASPKYLNLARKENMHQLVVDAIKEAIASRRR
jgi:hypothetical protein